MRLARVIPAFLLALIPLAALYLSGAAAASPPVPGAPEPPAPSVPMISEESGRLHPELRRMLKQSVQRGEQGDAYLPVIVEFRRELPASVGAPAAAPAAHDRLERRRRVVADLQAAAREAAGPLVSELQAATGQGLARNVRAFWVSPVVALEARPSLVESLARRADVLQVRPDEQFRLEEAPFLEVPLGEGTSGLAWNLAMIDAGLAREALGLDGSGVVVANLDTGVDWQHPALAAQYRGYRGRGLAVHWGNWHVSTDEPYLYPGDGNGHGTHTMGTMVGDDGEGHRVGVAPGARWIAVKLFTNQGVTYESWIHEAFQWIMAPEGDPALAPDVVNASWSSPTGSDERFRPDVKALRAAGIVPVFAAGNWGPQAGTVGSPASYAESLAVGAVDAERLVAVFSARGPSPWGEIKPEVVAPGANIVSTFPGGGYREAEGTSMAAPHAAGVAALLLQAGPELTPDEIEAILTATARPLGASTPDNRSGWGLINAYAAGLRAAAAGEITGHVVRSDGGAIARPAIAVVQRDGGEAIVVAGDQLGKFSVAVQPGRYDVTASAFGFEPETQVGIEVREGLETGTSFVLSARPAGSVFGRVTDLASGAPLSATVKVLDTPVSVSSDPGTGLYSIALPAGEYRATVTAEAHRVGHLEASVAAGAGQSIDVGLAPGPRILLVDGGRWYYRSQARYFEDGLTALDYPYRVWPVRDPFGQNGGPIDRPTRELLKGYDVVVWSAPGDSPGLIDADGALASYLWGGGRLLLSGQDVAYWDGGGTIFSRPAAYFTEDMGLWFGGEGDFSGLEGVVGTPLAGLDLAVNTADSAAQQSANDYAQITDSLLTQPALLWDDGTTAGTMSGTCRRYRAAWLGFGLEGVGPRSSRIGAMAALLDWLQAPPALFGLVATGPSAPEIGLPGTIVLQTIRLDATGVNSDTFDLSIEGGPWPLDLRLPDGRHVNSDTVFTLDGCDHASILATTSIPPGEPRDVRSTFNLRFASRGDPGVVVTVTLTAKTPAPILFVDDERWYDYQDRYMAAMDAAELAYDVYDTAGGDATPPADILTRYPMVVWTTGYDWFRSLTAEDEGRLSDYLDGGGRLLLSAQDLLDDRRVSGFVRDRLGVIGVTFSITSTEVASLPGSPLGEDLGPWSLTFPYTNWADGLIPGPGALGTLQDEHSWPVSVARPAANWRTAFFAFPLETLDDDPRRELLARTILWLSPLGESRLQAPRAAAKGSTFPVTLTLGLAADAPRDGLSASLPMPPDTAFVPGTAHGPWAFDPARNALVWTGALQPGVTVTLGADLAVSGEIAGGAMLPLRSYLYAGDGVTVTADAPVLIDVPWLVLRDEVTPTAALPGDGVDFVLAVTNRGVVATAAHLTDTLPSGLTVLPGTAWASRGDVTADERQVLWSGVLGPGEQAEIGFGARVTLDRSGARLVDRAVLTDERGRRVIGRAPLLVPAAQYLPMVVRGAE